MNAKIRNGWLTGVVAILALTLGWSVTACTNARHVILNAVGHEIRADIEGTHSIDEQPTHAIISGQFGKVTIERSRVRVEGLEWVAISENAPVAVRIVKHKLTVRAGGVSIARTIR